MKTIRSVRGIDINMMDMERVCHVPENEFLPEVQKVYPHAELFPTHDGRQLIFVNNNQPIIGVAHLDGTMPAGHFGVINDYNRRDIQILSPFVDDRMGVYTLLYILPQLGIEADLLFTVDEERGQSTAGMFTSERQYNWLFQFDRMGTDAVHYQYTKHEWLTALRKYFEKVSRGAFSDICHMYKLGSQGVNIGTGYYDYTTVNGWCSLSDLTSQCRRFENFYKEFRDVAFHHDPIVEEKKEIHYLTGMAGGPGGKKHQNKKNKFKVQYKGQGK